jgi:hypothetical protein
MVTGLRVDSSVENIYVSIIMVIYAWSVNKCNINSVSLIFWNYPGCSEMEEIHATRYPSW